MPETTCAHQLDSHPDDHETHGHLVWLDDGQCLLQPAADFNPHLPDPGGQHGVCGPGEPDASPSDPPRQTGPQIGSQADDQSYRQER